MQKFLGISLKIAQSICFRKAKRLASSVACLQKPKIYRGFSSSKPESEKDFVKFASEVTLPDDSVFTDKEQRLSFKLLNAKLIDEIYTIYKEENKPEDPLTPDQTALLFYFLCSFKQKIQDQPIFLEILSQALQNLESISTVYLLNFLWSLGLYRFEFQLKLDEKDKERFSEVISRKLDGFNAQQISSISFALYQIYSEPQDRANLHKLLAKTSEILLKNEQAITKVDIINFLIIFLSTRFSHEGLLRKFAEVAIQTKETLAQEDIEKIISLMSEVKYNHKMIYIELINKFTSLQDPTPEAACSIIFSISHVIPEELHLLRSLLKIIHSKWTFMNITDYVNLWLSLSKFRIKESEFTKTLSLLKTIPTESKVFKISDLEGFELINLVIAMSVLRINDRDFMALIVKELRKKMNGLSNADLVNLARSFVIYVRLFEDFLLEIHGKCCERFKEFDKEEVALLKKTFQRLKALLPDSPFVDRTV